MTCYGVAAMAALDMTPVSGCKTRRCFDCGEVVWISPATLRIKRKHDARIVCMPCAGKRLVKAGANPSIMGPTRAQVDELYAASRGWAAVLDPKVLAPGSVFEWQRVEWEVASYFEFPCCGLPIALIRRLEKGTRAWSGLGCPRCRDGKTYTVEQEPA